jgi:putative flippase GtrA
MRSSLPRFLLVGGTTVLIDALVYQLLLVAGLDTGLAKGVAFAAGAVFAYVANWRFTFQGQRNRWSPALFVLVYACALALNVGVNALVLSLLDDGTAYRLPIAFVVATGTSAAFNFLGMALLVFRPSARADSRS